MKLWMRENSFLTFFLILFILNVVKGVLVAFAHWGCP